VLHKQHRVPRLCISRWPNALRTFPSSLFAPVASGIALFKPLRRGATRSFWGRRFVLVQCPHQGRDPQGAGWGRESHRRDGELGRRLVRGRRGGQSFDPFRPPGEGVDPSIQAIGAGVKDPLFWGRRFVLVQSPVAGAALGGRPKTGFSQWGRNPRLLRPLFEPLDAAIPVIKPMSPGARAVFRALLEPSRAGIPLSKPFMPGLEHPLF
jgi:hypothetical protein